MSSFSKDLGLDSLDEVEVVMAVEEVRNNALYFNVSLQPPLHAGVFYCYSRRGSRRDPNS